MTTSYGFVLPRAKRHWKRQAPSFVSFNFSDFSQLIPFFAEMQDLSVTVIQTDLYWEDPIANRAMLEEKIASIKTSTDVIVLPEMFTTGFTMNASSLGERMQQQTFKWMEQMAKKTKALILGSFIANDGGKIYNRLLWMQPDGLYQTYDKRHLFRMGEENTVYTPGESRLVGNWKGWNICPLICYDLRFPVWSRNSWDLDHQKAAYDLLIYVANWPRVRVDAWTSLLKARAIENLSYVVGVNRVGIDGQEIEYNGQSQVFDPSGTAFISDTDAETILTCSLSFSELQTYRDKFPAYLDADNFSIEHRVSKSH
jgi:predicted amidohydrolase